MVKPTVFKMGAERMWWWRWILTQFVAALQKKKPVDIAPFSVRAIRPAECFEFFGDKLSAPFWFSLFFGMGAGSFAICAEPTIMTDIFLQRNFSIAWTTPLTPQAIDPLRVPIYIETRGSNLSSYGKTAVGIYCWTPEFSGC